MSLRSLIFCGIFILLDFHTLKGQSSAYNFNLDLPTLQTELMRASLRSDDNIAPATIKLPDDNGHELEFFVYNSPVISPEMSRLYPDFKTFYISAKNDHHIAGRIFVSRYGLEGMYELGSKQIKIEPISRVQPKEHKVYHLGEMNDLICLNDDRAIPKNFKRSIATLSNGHIRRVYDMAIVTTAEFFKDVDLGNNNMASANAAVTNIINLLNIRWNLEMSIHFNIAGTPVIYQDTLTDPFSPWMANLPTQAYNAINNSFNINSYDIGHVLHGTTAGGSGVAGIGVVCGNNKSVGWSGGSNPNTLAVGIMVHEVGHMMGSGHTFNGNAGACADQISDGASFEIGSGTTIMSYAGLCGSDNIQSVQDNYFHAKSLEFFITTADAGNCHTSISTGNTPPTVNANACNGTYTIPKMTPFSIQGSATDPDVGQNLSYVWEQIDEDGAGKSTQGYKGSAAGNSNKAPLFRSYPPSATGNKRIFPELNTILNNENVSTFEPLPNVARTLHFRLTARDNNASNGGCGMDDISVTVNGSSGPLTVTSPNGGTWSAGSQTVTWSVNNTNSLFTHVDILLSLDGGLTYAVTLATNTPNDGSHTLTFNSYPNISDARIKVRHMVNACFEIFDVSTAFSISSSCQEVASHLCNVTPVSFETGNAGLNMGLKQAYGDVISSKSLTTSGNTVNTPVNISPQTTGNATSCGFANFGFNTASFRFITTGGGTFSFLLDNAQFLGIYNMNYSNGTPCLNYVGGTMYYVNPNVYYSNQMDINLPSGCNEYIAVLFATNNTTEDITISPPQGIEVYEHAPPSTPGYAYTFIAKNTATDKITVQSATSDFTNLPVGSYQIFGIYYDTNTNPNTWIGQTLSSVINSGQCLTLSRNSKSVTVTCPIINLSDITYTENSGGIADDGIICSGANVTLGASGGGTYLWNNNATTATIVTAPINTTSYTVTVTNTYGCTATISTTVTVNGTVVNNGANSGAQTIRDIFGCIVAGGTITYQSGTNSVLTQSLNLDKNITIQGNGINNTTLNFNMGSGTGLTINSGITVTLKDLKISMSGGSTGPLIENHGNIILSNIYAEGNVNVIPIIRNNGSGTVILQNQNTIKKP